MGTFKKSFIHCRQQSTISGFEFDLTERLNQREGYHNFSQLTNANRNKLFEDNAQNSDVRGTVKISL